ncbi:ubiquitin-domain-containing protein [Sparassis crispa]|uniref:Ubiquitin-domain-containing protein n=1 Tax=Sparassis crispa TaxID=139825 RepID=A0A401GP95_9APHY|nr:ubiquitin-domain-containing protein [Sparassis crispa]GBE83969.1 ubiquitin-domain-containing protein [Sparassis crispa]
MSEQAELAFVKSFANNLISQPIVYADDFQQPPQSSLKKIPVLPIDLPPPPERKVEESTASASISITFKCIKPPQSYTLSVQPTDTISDIKAQLAAQGGAPPADAQRLLLKGKALADGKLLKEYSVKDGDTVNLMVKPGFDWDPVRVASPLPERAAPADGETIILLPALEPSKSRMGHGRIPSVVLSPSPSLTPSPGDRTVDIPLVLDTSNIPISPASGPSNASYHAVISQPVFWDNLWHFLSTELNDANHAETAWEDFFRASKGALSASEIAKIRDSVGVTGMAGT